MIRHTPNRGLYGQNMDAPALQRHMSPQARRRLIRSLTAGELADLAREITEALGLSPVVASAIYEVLSAWEWPPKPMS